jgi:cytochrome c
VVRPRAARRGALTALGLIVIAAAGPIGIGRSPVAIAAEASMPETLIGHGGPVRGIDADPAAGRVLTASFDYSVILWSLDGDGTIHSAGGTVSHRLLGHNAAVNDVAFVPGADKAVSVSDDGSMIVWDLNDGAMIRRLQDTSDKVMDVTVSADGRFAAIARWDDTARLIDLDSLSEVQRFEGHRGNVNAVAISADGEALYTGSYDGSIRAWDTATGKETALLLKHGWGINVLLLAGQSLVFGGLDGTIAHIDLETGSVHEIGKAERPVLSLGLSADGGRLAVGDGDGRIRVFNTPDWTQAEEYSNPNGPVWGLAFADSDGKTVYHSGLDDFAVLWQVEPRQPFEQPKTVYPRRFQLRADMSPGERQFQRRCSICHTLVRDDRNRAGPTLFGIFGRKAGSLPGYPYSEGLRKSDIVWNEETIARLFDHGPDVVTPGTKMPIQRLKSPADRDALIAFLKTATAPGKVKNGAANAKDTNLGDQGQ